MGGLLSVGAVLATASATRGVSDPDAEISAVGRVCLGTGVVMLGCAAVA